MITHRIGNLLEQPDIDVIIHQANLFHTFGAGIARAIKQKFPYAFEADLQSIYGTEDKLGGFTWGCPEVSGSSPIVVNMYSQTTLSPSHTSYDYMYEALTLFVDFIEPFQSVKKVGIPYGMGCGLADGNWEIVKIIIEQAFAESDIEVVIVKLPEA
jgi:O-acetyl-ADP-ribose deacetylase (regulator of RNase III)